ncbi:MAG: hypothetical protein M1831_006925 [Alyxoria varia]|nr:MAG: hypothetical protein M1831_006925 [Alyxoria varia]
MTSEHLTNEDLLSRFSCRWDWVDKSMISVSEPAKPSAIRRDSSASSAGLLDRLPLEILHYILDDLDFGSLSRMSQVSLRAKEIVESLPAYRELMKYAPKTLKALGQTGSISFHTAATLRGALRSQKCVSCQEYGAFLFLPTCERCCYECLSENHSLWVIPVSLAGRCFDLTPRQLKQLPTLHSIPGRYFVTELITRARRYQLTSVKVAKQHAVMAKGSSETSKRPLPARPSVRGTDKAWQEWYLLKRIQEAPLEPLSRNPAMIPDEGNKPNDKYGGMASIPFPSMTSSTRPENGLWCKGCQWTSERYAFQELSAQLISDLTPVGVDTATVLDAMAHRARSEADFLKHTSHCYGIRRQLPTLRHALDEK